MRQLTQKETENAPEWATHYLVTKLDYVVWQSKYLEDLNYGGTSPYYIDCGLHIDAQQIHRKEFDISEYLESDTEHPSQQPHIFEEDSCLHIDGKVSKFHAIGIAKYFKLTGGELKKLITEALGSDEKIVIKTATPVKVSVWWRVSTALYYTLIAALCVFAYVHLR